MSDLLEHPDPYETALVVRAASHISESSLLAENRRLRSCLAEAIAKVEELQRQLKRKPAGKATRAA